MVRVLLYIEKSIFERRGECFFDLLKLVMIKSSSGHKMHLEVKTNLTKVRVISVPTCSNVVMSLGIKFA